MNKMTDGHTVQSFNDEMNHLHGLVLRMTDLARMQLRDAVQSLLDENIDAARKVIESDQEINTLDVESGDEMIRLIAKRQPMAKDLREILTVGKIVTDLERIGDQARWVARLTIRFYDDDKIPPNCQLLNDIPKMAQQVDVMVNLSVEAFNELDLDKALVVLRMDQQLETDFKDALRRLSTYIMEDAHHVGHATDVVLGLRAVERAGGHAKNIAGHVVFLVKGRNVSHINLDMVAHEITGNS